MESSEAASRRMRCIASHLAAATAQNSFISLATVVCSSSSGSQSSHRKDGRLLYARQNSHVPAYLKDDKCTQLGRQVLNADPATQTLIRKDSRLMFARQGYHARSYFTREHVESQHAVHNPDNHSQASSQFQHGMDERYSSDREPPLFSRPSSKGGNEEWQAEKRAFKDAQAIHDESKSDWRPRMDISESSVTYVVTIELPGVNADGVRVEVNNNRLLVSGSRPLDLWADMSSRQSSEAVYHCRELLRGPFRAHWQLPKNSNVDSISAEFMDGFLRILVPKNTV